MKTIQNLSFFICFAAFASCVKTQDNTLVVTPGLTLTPAAANAIAGDLVKIDYTSTAVTGIKKIRIEVAYEQAQKIVALDTTFKNAKTADDEVFNYKVPDTAQEGQHINITFTVTDVKGHFVTKTAEVTVKGTRPRIALSVDRVTAPAGSTVNFLVDVLSEDNTLGKLEVSKSINGEPLALIETFTYSNLNAIHKEYPYTIPAGTGAGSSIYFLFRVTNNKGIDNFVSQTITVE